MSLLRKHNDSVWYMKYRPKKIEDMILPGHIKKSILNQIEKGDIMHMILSGQAGVGKTTIAYIISEQLNIPHKYFNFSSTSGIDSIRYDFTEFAKQRSIESFMKNDIKSSKKKMIIGDEFDRLSGNAMDALKGVIEQCSENCIFIFTTNHVNKVIDPIKSRCSILEFTFKKNELLEARKMFYQHVTSILEKENVSFEPQAVADLNKMNFPDMRKTIVTLQEIANSGNAITKETIKTFTFVGIEKLFEIIKNREYGLAMEYVSNLSIDLKTIYSIMHNDIVKYLKPESIPKAIIILSEFQNKAAISIDPLIDINACIANLMVECEWK